MHVNINSDKLNSAASQKTALPEESKLDNVQHTTDWWNDSLGMPYSELAATRIYQNLFCQAMKKHYNRYKK